MDDAIFGQFLHEQEQLLSAITHATSASETNIAALENPPPRAPLPQSLQTRLDATARRLADAYLMCSDGQRQDIRRLIGSYSVAQMHMGIAPERIKLRIDGVYFRLALIYESMKDLRPDAGAAMVRLDDLCKATRIAGFDGNPHLREVAGVSSRVSHSGIDSMQSLLLQRIVEEETIVCPRCDKHYPRRLPGCPRCAADPARLGTPGHRSELLEEAISAFIPEEELIKLPTRKVLLIMSLSLAVWASLVLTIVLVVVACIYPAYYLTWPSWTWIAFNLVLYGLLRYFRFGQLCKEYARDGKWRVAIEWWQWLLFFVVVFAILFAVVGTIRLYQALSW
jgi:hypothetical protein